MALPEARRRVDEVARRRAVWLRFPKRRRYVEDRLLAVTCELADEFKDPGTQLTAWGTISEGIVLGVLAGLRVSGAFDEAKSGRTGGDASKTG